MGPLHGLKVLEIEALGPVPWTAMMLSDMGADVLRVDRQEAPDLGVMREKKFQFTERGRRSVVADLKSSAGRNGVLALVEKADILLEGMRPGVMERLGLGPEVCLARNPALIYGRMTGWGQTGPMAHTVGHDINYIATVGVLHAIGTAGAAPVVPLNLIGDFGGGGMLLLAGVLAALHSARSQGKGQVVDAAMVDGSMALMASVLGRHAAGEWKDERQANILDGAAHFYGSYRTSDSKYIAIGAIEPKFYKALLSVLGLNADSLPPQYEQGSWPAMRERFAELFAGRTRDQWCAAFDGVEACFSPVLALGEIAAYPHNAQRDSFVDVDGQMHPAPAPRFSLTPSRVSGPPVGRGDQGGQAVADWGFAAGDAAISGLSWTGRGA